MKVGRAVEQLRHKRRPIVIVAVRHVAAGTVVGRSRSEDYEQSAWHAPSLEVWSAPSLVDTRSPRNPVPLISDVR